MGEKINELITKVDRLEQCLEKSTNAQTTQNEKILLQVQNLQKDLPRKENKCQETTSDEETESELNYEEPSSPIAEEKPIHQLPKWPLTTLEEADRIIENLNNNQYKKDLVN